jgi:hypothetical protein
MTTKWYVRNGAGKFLATGGFSAWGPNTIGWVERFQDAAPFDSAYHARDIADTFLPPGRFDVVDYFDHPPLPADADPEHPETQEQRDERVRAEEAVRLHIRKKWGIKRAV